MKKAITLIPLLLLVALFQFCSKKDCSAIISTELQPTLPSSTFIYLPTYPAHVQVALASSDNAPTDNPITNAGATLGRVLFYDKQLSKNNTVSCGSCHQQAAGFDDTLALSKGFEAGLTTRNSMSLLNIRFYKSGKMFWDERATSTEKQALQPIQNHLEMGLTLAELETKVKSLTYYPSLFEKAFGSSLIDSVNIAKALAQFERSIVTYQSKYDSVKQGLVNFTTAEADGEQFFLTAGAPRTCASCHTPPMFITSSPETKFGLNDANDAGINGNNNFKSGSLRNSSSRSHLFHNGSVTNVQTMLAAGNPGSTINAIPQHSVRPQAVANMMAFLNTLTDYTILTEKKFSNPFPL